MSACPECLGPHRPDSAAGHLTFDHDQREGCTLGDAQDSRAHADWLLLSDPLGPDEAERPPTAAEVTLAAVFGLPAPDAVVVRRVTRGGGVTERVPAWPPA